MSKSIVLGVVAPETAPQFLSAVDDPDVDFMKLKSLMQVLPVSVEGKIEVSFKLSNWFSGRMNDATGRAFYRLIHPGGSEEGVVWLEQHRDALAALTAAARAYVPVDNSTDDFRPEGDDTVKQVLLDFVAAAQGALDQHGSQAVLLVCS